MTQIDQAAAQQDVREKVRAGYAGIATADKSASAGCCTGSSCCGPDSGDAAAALARAIGYGEQDLAHLPDGANMGLSCGNPTAIAELREGETIVDLGSGGGFDIFVAGRKIGATGRAIGVDMTPEMVAKARRNAVAYRERTGLQNVEFRLGEIENLPVGDALADVVLSNCVINLSPDKPRVWREIARVLKPGGRVAISDLALVRPLPPSVQTMVEALVGCVAGASLIDEIRAMMEAAGFVEIELHRKDAYVDAMTDWNDPLYARIVAELPSGSKASDFVTSLDISARKPA